jgi:alkylation response protein AidB-like acyl-CoA dehydrogenase/predicted heme/steroid binding protein
MGLKTFTVSDVSSHNTENDCWIIVHNKVYDMTPFLNDHPGGKKIVLKVAGQDASKQFDNFHNQAILDKYTPKLCIGEIGSASSSSASASNEQADEEIELTRFGELVPYGDPTWYQEWHTPYYKDHHAKFRSAVRKFVDTHITPNVHEWDEKKGIPAEVFRLMADNGLLALAVGNPFPKDYYKGKVLGYDDVSLIDPFTNFIFGDELARCGSGGVLWGTLGGLGIGLPPILKFGSEELKQKVAPDCLAGKKFICLAITEPSGGSDVANITTEAKLSDDGEHYIVNGEKKWITNGVWADYFTVAVRTGEPGMKGISLLLIERNMPGVKTRQMDCTGVWASGTAYITFEDVKVPKANIIGKVNGGFKCIMYNFNQERMGIIIQANRFSRVCFEEALKYAHKRKTFGKRLVDHPVIRMKFAQMARQIEATHAWIEQILYQTCMQPFEQQVLTLGGPIALCKAQCTQVLEYCVREAVQIFGGIAYTRGGQGEKVERLNREVRAYSIPGGSEEIMLELGIRQSMKVMEFIRGSKL